MGGELLCYSDFLRGVDGIEEVCKDDLGCPLNCDELCPVIERRLAV